MPEYTKMKNSDLEGLLKERGLPHNGRKAEMVARLQEADETSPATDGQGDATAAKTANTVSESVAVASTENASTKPSEPAVDDATADKAPANGEPTDGEDEKPTATFSANLASTSLDEEIARRKKRAEKFGMSEQESNAIKNLERQKRFGTGPAEAAADAEGVNRLDEALPERKQRGKRTREEGGETFEDPGLKRQRGGFRGRGRGRRDPPRGGRSGNGGGSWMTEADKAAAEKRKAKYA